jgi:hypothetical protein
MRAFRQWTVRPDAYSERPAVLSAGFTFSSHVLTRLADALSVPDGGFSFDMTTGADCRSGYAVAVYPALERRIAGRVSSAHLMAYIVEHRAVLARPAAVFGGWRNPSDRLAYMDVSIVVRDRRLALMLATAYAQSAIWDFERGMSISILPKLTNNELHSDRRAYGGLLPNEGRPS